MMLAGVLEPFKQFTQADYCASHGMRADQNWWGAQLVTLDVKGGSSVWLSNYVSSFYAPTPDLHGSQFDMLGSHKYGYIYAADLAGLSQEDYADAINWSDGSKTTEITYYSDSNPELKTTTTGYLLGSFDEDAEIYLVMTTMPADGGETVDSYQYVQDAEHGTSLISRQHSTFDAAGNVRVNYGIDSASIGPVGREFVAVYDATGQPLPGLAVSCLLAFGAVGAAKLRKKKQ